MSEQLKQQVRQLDRLQLVELQTYIKGLLAAPGSSPREPAGVDLLLAVFEEGCRRFGLGYVSPPVRRMVAKQEPVLTAFLAQACPGSTVLVRQTILATAFDLLYRDLQDNGRVVNPRSLAYGVDRFPALLDRSFPAYAVCGLLPKIVQEGSRK